jgi:hypothetical protein
MDCAIFDLDENTGLCLNVEAMRIEDRAEEKELVRILHAADFHLDSPFASLSWEKAAERRKEQRRLLEQIAQLSENVGHCLLSGDLFDSGRLW